MPIYINDEGIFGPVTEGRYAGRIELQCAQVVTRGGGGVGDSAATRAPVQRT
jgi:hypothetical protein